MKKVRSVRYPGKAAAALPLQDAIAAPPPASDAMVRTQLYLNRVEHEFVQAEASRQGGTMAGVIRALIRERMQVPDRTWEQNPLLDPPADPGFRGPGDGVLNHDHYIYGGPRRWVKQSGRWIEAPPLPADYFENPASAAAYDAHVARLR